MNKTLMYAKSIVLMHLGKMPKICVHNVLQDKVKFKKSKLYKGSTNINTCENCGNECEECILANDNNSCTKCIVAESEEN